MPDLIYNKDEILKLIEAQKNNPTLDTENRGVTFLYGLANGRIGLTEDAKEVIPEYFDILRQSRHPLIKSSLSDAEKAFAAQHTGEAQVSIDAPVLSDEVKHNLEDDTVFTDPEIERFNGLLDKDNLEITSEEYIFMADILARRQINAKKAANFDEIKSINQQFAYLAGMAQDKINQIFEGNIPSDEEFQNFVDLLGSSEQKEILSARTRALADTGYQFTSQDLEDVIDTSVVEKTAPVVNEPEPVVEEPIISEPEPVSFVEEPIVPQPTPVKKKKTPKKSSKKVPAHKSVKTSELPLEAIVYNSRKLATMNAKELLEIAKRIDELDNERQKRRMKSAFRYFIIQKLDNSNKINLAEEGLDILAQNFGTEKQRKMFGAPSKLEPEVTPIPIVTPAPDVVSSDENKVAHHSEPKKEKKAKEVKLPWYKRVTGKIVASAAVFFGAIVAVAGIAKMAFSSDNAIADNNAPKKEVKAQNPKKSLQDTKTADFNKERGVQANTMKETKVKDTQKVEETSKVEETKKAEDAKKVEKALQNVQTKMNNLLFKEDAKCAKRTAKFLKKIAQNHNISVEEAQQRLDNFVNNLDLPKGVSSYRMSYLASIHALFPNSEFGITANKIFDGETVHVSKEDISKLDKEFSKPGKFGHKNNKYNTTLQLAKTKAHTR